MASRTAARPVRGGPRHARTVLAVPFTPSWLAGDSAATALLPRSFGDSSARAAAVARAAGRRVDPAVLATISASSPAQRAQRDRLAAGGCAAVVTGQQAGLFGGPLYTVYKAAAAIVDARALEAETGTPCVPVFWLQDEDHDFAEIAGCAVPQGEGVLRVGVDGDSGSELRSVAFRTLGPTVGSALDGVEAALEGLSETAETMALLREAWRADVSPAAAFRAWIEALFADHGLLVVDPAHPGLASAAEAVHRRSIDEAEAIGAVLGARAAALEDAGFAVQVHVRDGSPLSFVHPEGREGPRFRVEPDGDGLRLCGTDGRVTRAQLEAGPWSTSALLRPILQDSWLPTAAYVGGPGEIAYFAQLPPLYEHFGLPMPLIVPRARFEVVDAGCRRLLDQLGLSREALDQPRPRLLEAVARPAEGPDPDALQRALVDPVLAALGEFHEVAAAVDPGLAKVSRKTEQAMVDGATRLVDRYRRELARRDEVTMGRLDRLLARLRPEGAPQERVHGWPWYGARYGVKGFVDAVLAAVRPFHGALEELDP